jgi:hypothetical protein
VHSNFPPQSRQAQVSQSDTLNFFEVRRRACYVREQHDLQAQLVRAVNGSAARFRGEQR